VQRISQQVKLWGTKIDTDPPRAVISLDSAVNVPLDTLVYIEMSEPVRKAGGGMLDYRNIDSLLVLKLGGPEGADLPFDAVISTDRTLITITPDTMLADSQVYYIAISDAWEDYSGNPGTAVSSVFYTYKPGPSTGLNPKLSGVSGDRIRIYPNPGTGAFVLSFPDITSRQIAVYDLRGRRVRTWENIHAESHLLDLSDQPGSVYFIRIKEKPGGQTHTLKLIKQ
jgi:hypothetical protein